jgi:hypothetical protein
VLAEHAAAADDDLELVVLVKMRADHAFVIAFDQKAHRLFAYIRAFGIGQEIGAPAFAARQVALDAVGFDVVVGCDMRHDGYSVRKQGNAPFYAD